MSELTREEIAKIFHRVWLHADEQGEQETRVMAYIAALRAKIEALEKDVAQLNNVLRHAGWGQGEIDSAAYTFDKLAKANTGLVNERDRLKEAAESLCIECMYTMQAALRGETGGA
jgi:uncharacterized protein Smg (DUF494 family)